jgi:hypothetical protein
VGDGVALEEERVLDGHGVEHLGELGVSEGQRPETEVGCAEGFVSVETETETRTLPGMTHVLEMHPRQNSMVWMTWWMMMSPISKG